jgi:hypothetical protein
METQVALADQADQAAAAALEVAQAARQHHQVKDLLADQDFHQQREQPEALAAAAEQLSLDQMVQAERVEQAVTEIALTHLGYLLPVLA